MFQSNIDLILVILAVINLVALPFVNRFYQKRADVYIENLLLEIPDEYNKQIKANAYRYLISRMIFGLLSAWIGTYNLRVNYERNHLFAVAYLILAVGYFAWAIYGYKSEMKKIKEL